MSCSWGECTLPDVACQSQFAQTVESVGYAVLVTDLRRQYEAILAELGELLSEHREASNLDQKSVGRAAGVSDTYVSKLERAATSHPSMATGLALARAVGADENRVRRLLVAAKIAKSFMDENGVDADDLLAAVRKIKRGERRQIPAGATVA